MPQPRAVLSVDFESFATTPAYRSASGTVPEPENIGPETMERLLGLLESYDADATFFTVGQVAQSHPDRIRAAADAGHEIASHTQTHPFLTDLTHQEQREELTESRDVLEEIAGVSVDGFRAPMFDIGDEHFQLLEQTDYRYDSSIVPSRSIPGWYGGEWSTHRPTPASEIVSGAPETVGELPLSVMPQLRLPLTGTWIRFFGVRYTLLGMKLLAREEITPVLYVHPWELVSLPSVEGLPKRLYVRTGAWMWRAIERILQTDFEFVTARSVVEDALGTGGEHRE